MAFRPADSGDEEFFWIWRLKAEKQGREGCWWEGIPTTREQHHEWFQERLGRIKLLVWYVEHGRPAGIVRIDSNGEVAFNAPALLVVRMLEELKDLAVEYGGRLKVTVDYANVGAAKSLRAAGFKEYPVRFYCFRP